jgi:hypothetical protein
MRVFRESHLNGVGGQWRPPPILGTGLVQYGRLSDIKGHGVFSAFDLVKEGMVFR